MKKIFDYQAKVFLKSSQVVFIIFKGDDCATDITRGDHVLKIRDVENHIEKDKKPNMKLLFLGDMGKVARVVHQIRKRLLGKIVRAVVAQDDANVFGKVGTTATEFQDNMMGKRILDAGQQGKYFWLIMSSPPHPVLHFGMSGWLHIRGESKLQFKSRSLPNDKMGVAEEEWPPKYWKFTLEAFDDITDKNFVNEDSKVDAAFTDPRRFGRIRFLNCSKENIRKTSPLKENGPDPIVDKHILTLAWLESKLKTKHVPVKTFLLDQTNISGIGNWVGDEILYHSRIHPEQYCDTLRKEQIQKIHHYIMYVCETAVEALADPENFPDEWLFNYRWDKAKLTRKSKKINNGDKTSHSNAIGYLPNGAKIKFVTVGGRTSCIVPSVQQKTLANELENEENDKEIKNQGCKGKNIKTERKENTSREKDQINNDMYQKKVVQRKRRRGLDILSSPEKTRNSPRLQNRS